MLRAQGGGNIYGGRRRRSHAPALSPHPDDFNRLHPGRGATHDRDGRGAASQHSLGTVVFGGMLASTLLAIPFVSVFYIVMDGFSERRRARKGADPAQVKVGGRGLKRRFADSKLEIRNSNQNINPKI